MQSKLEYVIEPPRGFLVINLGELWRFRDLFRVLAWRDISIRYKQTAMGIAWAVVQPIIQMVIFTFIFNRVGRIGSGDDTPYPVFLYTGLLLWRLYQFTLTQSANSMTHNAQLIQKIYFPRLIAPATAATTALVDFAIASTILAGMMVWYRYVPSWQGLALLPVLILCSILASLGLGLFLAGLNVKYRDVRHALPFFIQMLMYVTPVIYPVSILKNHPYIQWLMELLNPMTGVIQNARAGLLGQGSLDLSLLSLSLVVSAAYFIFGLYYFRYTERYFADLV